MALTDADRALHADRRRRLAQLLPDGCVAVLPAALEAHRNGDVEHSYRQHSDLFYLTGFEEPESLVLLTRSGDDVRFELVVRPRDRDKEIWHGRRAGVEGAVSGYLADAAHSTDELAKVLHEALVGQTSVAYAMGDHGPMDALITSELRRFRHRRRTDPAGPTQLVDPFPLLAEMRLIKSEAEIALMQRAADITAEAHNAAMRGCRPGMTERQIQAIVEGTFRMHGAARNGYGSIVAGGVNATILHYTENDQPIGPDDLVLIDAGAEYCYYTADVTRTFPAGGRYRGAQRDVYEVVLAAQLASIAATRAGATFESVHDVSVRALVEGLVALDLLSGDVDALIEEAAYKRFYMHRTGHWLGMDVHDVGEYVEADGTSRLLRPGMVLTVEPGLYIAEDDDEAPEAFRGIGVRIEDDILVTADGPRNLTAACPKAIDEVEALMAEAPRPFIG